MVLVLVLSAGCGEDWGGDDDGIWMLYDSMSDVPEGGWDGLFEVPSDVDVRRLEITDNGDRTITFSIYVDLLDGGWGELTDQTVEIVSSEDGEEAWFTHENGFAMQLALSPKSVRITYADKTQDAPLNPYCVGATFEGKYIRSKYY